MALTPRPRLAVPKTGQAVVIKPTWQSTYPDTGDTTKLGPAAWNTERFVSGGDPGDVVMRDPASSTGASWATLPPLATTDDVTAGDAATLASANSHSDTNDAATLASAQAYADGLESGSLDQAKAYADAQDATMLASANSHSDAQDATTLSAARSYSDGGDSATLTSARSYADSKDATTLASAKTYADSGDATTLAQAKAYTDTKPGPGLKKLATLATVIPLPVTTPVNTDVDLWTYTLPAGSLATDGAVLQLQSWGQFLAVNAGSRTIKLLLGTLTVGSLTYSGSQLKTWVLNATLIRANATNQSCVAFTDGDPSLVASVQLGTLDLTQAQTLRLQARQGGTPPSPSLQVVGGLVTQW